MAEPLDAAEIAAIRSALDASQAVLAATEETDESVAGRLTPIQIAARLHAQSEAVRSLAAVVLLLIRYVVGTPPPS